MRLEHTVYLLQLMKLNILRNRGSGLSYTKFRGHLHWTPVGCTNEPNPPFLTSTRIFNLTRLRGQGTDLLVLSRGLVHCSFVSGEALRHLLHHVAVTVGLDDSRYARLST